jgi:hypothetical protein
MSRNATSNETCNRPRVRFIFGEFLSPAAIQALCLAQGFRVPWVGDRGVQTIAAQIFRLELGEMMCEKKREVKQGLIQMPDDVAREESLTGHAAVSGLISKL